VVVGLSEGEILCRVAAALAAGTALGFEREGHGRAAGLKTMVLACVASCLAILLSEMFYAESAARLQGFMPDRSRLAAGILTGIGFLGAGAILRHGNSIRGVTTGAVLWYATILGMACGSGRYLIAGLGTGIALGVLNFFPYFENRLRRDGFARLTLAVDSQHAHEEDFTEILSKLSLQITETQRSVDLAAREKVLEYQLKYHRAWNKDYSRQAVDSLSALPGIRRIRWE